MGFCTLVLYAHGYKKKKYLIYFRSRYVLVRLEPNVSMSSISESIALVLAKLKLSRFAMSLVLAVSCSCR